MSRANKYLPCNIQVDEILTEVQKHLENRKTPVVETHFSEVQG